MVDAAGPQAALGDLEAAALPQDEVVGGHPHAVEVHDAVAVGGVVEAKQGQHALHPQARGVAGHQDHRLLEVGGGGGVGAAHDDEHPAARIADARGPPLGAVDDVVVAVALDAGLDVGGVAGGHVGLGHGEGRADIAIQQGNQPLGLLGRRAVAGQDLHVAGVGGRAVEDLGGPHDAAGDLAEGGVLLVGEASAVGGVGQEEVPQPGGFGLGLEVLQEGHRLPAIGGHGGGKGRLVGVDVRVHEGEQALTQGGGAGGQGKVHGGSSRALSRRHPAAFGGRRPAAPGAQGLVGRPGVGSSAP